MKLITTASLCSAAFIPGSVFRIDRSGTFEAFKSGQFLKSELNLHPVSKAPLSTADSFVINLECEVGTTKSTCDNVKNTLVSAARKIAANLVIHKPIVIKAQYRDFCANTSVETCPLRDVLGGARYASAFVIKKDGAYYTCNQAVIKQMNTNVNPPFSDVDIVADFHSKANWFFSNEPVAKDKIDLEFVAIHEITHGIGFGTALINYYDVFGGEVSKGYIAPLPIGILKKKSVTSATIFNGLEPIDIFDSFIGNFKNLGIKLAGLGMKKLALGSFLYELEHSGRPFDAAKEMYSSATSNTLKFVPINGSAIPIYSPSSYEQGSTISHVRKSLESTEDFIMIPGVSAGISLANTMSKINVNNVYGRGILSVLESIGWNTNPGQPQKNVELALDYQGEIPAAIGGGTLLFPHLWILLLFMLVI